MPFHQTRLRDARRLADQRLSSDMAKQDSPQFEGAVKAPGRKVPGAGPQTACILGDVVETLHDASILRYVGDTLEIGGYPRIASAGLRPQEVATIATATQAIKDIVETQFLPNKHEPLPATTTAPTVPWSATENVGDLSPLLTGAAITPSAAATVFVDKSDVTFGDGCTWNRGSPSAPISWAEMQDEGSALPNSDITFSGNPTLTRNLNSPKPAGGCLITTQEVADYAGTLLNTPQAYIEGGVGTHSFVTLPTAFTPDKNGYKLYGRPNVGLEFLEPLSHATIRIGSSIHKVTNVAIEHDALVVTVSTPASRGQTMVDLCTLVCIEEGDDFYDLSGTKPLAAGTKITSTYSGCTPDSIVNAGYIRSQLLLSAEPSIISGGEITTSLTKYNKTGLTLSNDFVVSGGVVACKGVLIPFAPGIFTAEDIQGLFADTPVDGWVYAFVIVDVKQDATIELHLTQNPFTSPKPHIGDGQLAIFCSSVYYVHGYGIWPQIGRARGVHYPIPGGPQQWLRDNKVKPSDASSQTELRPVMWATDTKSVQVASTVSSQIFSHTPPSSNDNLFEAVGRYRVDVEAKDVAALVHTVTHVGAETISPTITTRTLPFTPVSVTFPVHDDRRKQAKIIMSNRHALSQDAQRANAAMAGFTSTLCLKDGWYPALTGTLVQRHSNNGDNLEISGKGKVFEGESNYCMHWLDLATFACNFIPPAWIAKPLLLLGGGLRSVAVRAGLARAAVRAERLVVPAGEVVAEVAAAADVSAASFAVELTPYASMRNLPDAGLRSEIATFMSDPIRIRAVKKVANPVAVRTDILETWDLPEMAEVLNGASEEDTTFLQALSELQKTDGASPGFRIDASTISMPGRSNGYLTVEFNTDFLEEGARAHEAINAIYQRAFDAAEEGADIELSAVLRSALEAGEITTQQYNRAIALSYVDRSIWSNSSKLKLTYSRGENLGGREAFYDYLVERGGVDASIIKDSEYYQAYSNVYNKASSSQLNIMDNQYAIWRGRTTDGFTGNAFGQPYKVELPLRVTAGVEQATAELSQFIKNFGQDGEIYLRNSITPEGTLPYDGLIIPRRAGPVPSFTTEMREAAQTATQSFPGGKYAWETLTPSQKEYVAETILELRVNSNRLGWTPETLEKAWLAERGLNVADEGTKQIYLLRNTVYTNELILAAMSCTDVQKFIAYCPYAARKAGNFAGASLTDLPYVAKYAWQNRGAAVEAIKASAAEIGLPKSMIDLVNEQWLFDLEEYLTYRRAADMLELSYQKAADVAYFRLMKINGAGFTGRLNMHMAGAEETTMSVVNGRAWGSYIQRDVDLAEGGFWPAYTPARENFFNEAYMNSVGFRQASAESFGVDAARLAAADAARWAAIEGGHGAELSEAELLDRVYQQMNASSPRIPEMIIQHTPTWALQASLYELSVSSEDYEAPNIDDFLVGSQAHVSKDGGDVGSAWSSKRTNPAYTAYTGGTSTLVKGAGLPKGYGKVFFEFWTDSWRTVKSMPVYNWTGARTASILRARRKSRNSEAT